jgi:hypothetical protein
VLDFKGRVRVVRVVKVVFLSQGRKREGGKGRGNLHNLHPCGIASSFKGLRVRVARVASVAGKLLEM